MRGPNRSRRRRKERRHRPNRRGLSRKRADAHVTVSIVLAEPTRTAVTAEDVIKAADKTLDRAKEHGRNRVEINGSRQVQRGGRGLSYTIRSEKG